MDGGLPHRLWQMIADNFRAFVALTFEEICLAWLVTQAQQENLPFAADNVGAHWSKTVQVDVAAINWREQGGQVVFAGTPADLKQARQSLTSQYV